MINNKFHTIFSKYVRFDKWNILVIIFFFLMYQNSTFHNFKIDEINIHWFSKGIVFLLFSSIDYTEKNVYFSFSFFYLLKSLLQNISEIWSEHVITFREKNIHTMTRGKLLIAYCFKMFVVFCCKQFYVHSVSGFIQGKKKKRKQNSF